MYGKVFDTIYDGTLYGHWEAIVTMQQLIVLATPDGVVDMTPQAISARTSIPFEIIEKGLKVLSEADPYTRTPGDEGRRIVLMDDHRPWGWRLVNHGKYKRLRDVEQKRAADRERIAEKRNKNIYVATVSPIVAEVAHSDSDSDSDSDSKRSTPLSATADGAFEKFWKTYPRKTARRKAWQSFRRLKPDDALLAAMLQSVEAHKATEQWKRGIIPHGATWLNQRRWEDEIQGTNIPVVRLTCEDEIRPGERCGMPGTRDAGGTVRCEHCRRKRLERSSAPMPPHVKAAFADLKKSKHPE